MQKKNLYRSLFLVAAVILLVTLACDIGGGGNSPSASNGGNNNDNNNESNNENDAGDDLAATQQSLSQTQDALDAQQNAPPADTLPPPPVQPSPTTQQQVQPQPQPSPTTGVQSWQSGDVIYFTDFDSANSEPGWVHFSLPEIDYQLYTQGGYLRIEVPETYTSVIAIYDDLYFQRDAADVWVEAKFENRATHNINNVSVICRFDVNQGWYEFSLLSGGLWYIWRYDVDKGSYKLLTDGGIAGLDYDAPHVIAASCNDDTLTFYLDGEKVKNATIKDSTYRSGATGISVYADDWKDVIIEFDYFGLMVP